MDNLYLKKDSLPALGLVYFGAYTVHVDLLLTAVYLNLASLAVLPG